MKILSYILYLQLFISSSAAASSFCVDTFTIPKIDTSIFHPRPKHSIIADYNPTVAGMTIPILMVSYGFAAQKMSPLQNLNHSAKAELREDHPNFHTTIDDQLKYAPALAVYALNLMGIEGKHNFRDRTIILGMSALIMTSSVGILKSSTHVLRPDNSTYNSFPSGHTSTAFAGAEFMYQEYKDVSPWIGVAGYAAATATGALRMYNNRHWLSDVVTGAGVGILSTKAAYWLYPKMQRIFTSKSSMQTMFMPTYDTQWKTMGVSVVFFPH